MADHHEIVEQIRGFLQASDQTRSDRLDNLAKAFTHVCIEANQRLARCGRLLQQGLRSEAIQQAEAEPRLLDAITTLDFPEAPSGTRSSTSMRWPRPPSCRLTHGRRWPMPMPKPSRFRTCYGTTAGWQPSATAAHPDRRHAQTGRPGFEEPDLD